MVRNDFGQEVDGNSIKGNILVMIKEAHEYPQKAIENLTTMHTKQSQNMN